MDTIMQNPLMLNPATATMSIIALLMVLLPLIDLIPTPKVRVKQ